MAKERSSEPDASDATDDAATDAPKEYATYRLKPGQYSVAVRAGEEVEFEVMKDGKFTPSNDDEQQAMTTLAAKQAKN